MARSTVRSAPAGSNISLSRFLKSAGLPRFRSQLARNYVSLLEIDPAVSEWTTEATTLRRGSALHAPTLQICRDGEIVLVDVVSHGENSIPDWVEAVAADGKWTYEIVREDQISRTRLENAADMIRYAHIRVPFADRTRVLTVLHEVCSISVADLIWAFRETEPIAGLASMLIRGDIETDLEVRFGPDSIIRRRHT